MHYDLKEYPKELVCLDMYDKVFISHAKEDKEAAFGIYNFLKSSTSFKPWLDKVNILPGHNWREEINLALKSADFIVILFSKIAVEKKGYVQKEFKLALDYCEERPEGAIYIIPVLLEDCNVPEKFAKYQWVTISDPDFHESIYASLRKQRDRYLSQETERIARSLSYGFETKTLEETVGNRIVHTLEIRYPQFSNTGMLSLKHLNTYFLAEVYRRYNWFIKHNEPEQPNGNPNVPHNEYRSVYNLELITPKLISLTVFNYEYSGGAHGNYATDGRNYELAPLIELTLQELLGYQEDALAKLGQICKQKLLAKGREEFGVTDEREFFLGDFDEQVNWDFLSNFYIGQRTLNILFAPYEVTAYAYGKHDIEISFDELYTDIGQLQKLKEIDTYFDIK